MAKIAIINQRYGLEINGGSEYHARIIAEKLSIKHEVEIITTCCLDHLTWENYYKKEIDIINNITVRRFPTIQNRIIKQTDDPEQWLEYQGPVVPALIEYVKNNKDNYDIFIPMTYLYYPCVYSIPYIAEKSIVIPTAHDEKPIYLPIFKRVFGADPEYPKPAFFMYNTIEEKNFIHKLFQNQYIDYEIGGIGIEMPAYIDSNRFRNKFKIKDDYIIYAGRIDVDKGCEYMIKYFIEYKKRNNNSNLKFILMGKKEINIPEREDIIYLGFVSEEDKMDGLAAAKLLWLNSMFESLSIVVLEAFSLGIPVLVNGHSEVLKGHCERSNAGLFYKGYFEFEGVLNYLLSHNEVYTTMGINGKKYVNENYDWNVIMNKFEKAINYIINKNK